MREFLTSMTFSRFLESRTLTTKMRSKLTMDLDQAQQHHQQQQQQQPLQRRQQLGPPRLKLPQHQHQLQPQQQHQTHESSFLPVPPRIQGEKWMGPKLFSLTLKSTAETRSLKTEFTLEDSHLHQQEEQFQGETRFPTVKYSFLSKTFCWLN